MAVKRTTEQGHVKREPTDWRGRGKAFKCECVCEGELPERKPTTTLPSSSSSPPSSSSSSSAQAKGTSKGQRYRSTKTNEALWAVSELQCGN